MENPRNIFRATREQSIAKYIERIADHATNLAEMVVFMVHGKDIRHIGKLERRVSVRTEAAAPDATDSDASLRDLTAPRPRTSRS
jgi:phosphate transport system protein